MYYKIYVYISGNLFKILYTILFYAFNVFGTSGHLFFSKKKKTGSVHCAGVISFIENASFILYPIFQVKFWEMVPSKYT